MKSVKYLNKSGTISLVAPSFGCVVEPYATRLKIAINNLRKDGFNVDEGENIYLAKSNARSNSAKKCGEEFMKAYLSSSDCVISVGGGELMCEILPFIDFDAIKSAEPKYFMGFSDNTNLTYTIATIADVPTIYGPCVSSFAFKPYKFANKDAMLLLEGKTKTTKGYPVWERYKNESDDPLSPSNLTEKKVIKVLPNVSSLSIKGRLLGGCLDCLQVLCGTRFDKTKEYIEKYKDDGIIFFLEACDLNPLSIERALFQLKEAGWFKYIKGFIMGRPLCYKTKVFGIDHYKAIKTALSDLNVPIIMDADLGHFDPSMPIITGALATVEYKNKNIYVTY